MTFRINLKSNLKKKVTIVANNTIRIAKLSLIQFTGRIPINTSRVVPPPYAITKDKITAPNKSNFLVLAFKTPVTAKTKIPK